MSNYTSSIVLSNLSTNDSNEETRSKVSSENGLNVETIAPVSPKTAKVIKVSSKPAPAPKSKKEKMFTPKTKEAKEVKTPALAPAQVAPKTEEWKPVLMEIVSEVFQGNLYPNTKRLRNLTRCLIGFTPKSGEIELTEGTSIFVRGIVQLDHASFSANKDKRNNGKLKNAHTNILNAKKITPKIRPDRSQAKNWDIYLNGNGSLEFLEIPKFVGLVFDIEIVGMSNGTLSYYFYGV